MKPRDVSLVLVLTLTPGVVTAQPEPDLHVELAAFEKALDEAVGHVSRPGTVHLLGSAHGSRGYYLAGFGAVFVVPPRSLPAPRPKVIVHRRSGRGEREVQVQIQIQNLERSLARFESAEIRQLMEQSLEQLRSAPVAAQAGSGAEESEIVDREPPHRVRQVRERRRQDSEERERQLQVLEQQAAQLQREAERVKEVAERRIEDLMRDVSVHLAESRPGAPPTPAAPAPEPTSPAEPPTPPAPPAPLQRPAPWSFWFELSEIEEQGRSLDAVVTDIREAMTGVLESHGVRLRTLRPEEVVVVAVDFVRRTAFPSFPRPERTVLLRIKKKELDARRAGQISSEELERRIEVVQY
jgi:hypothetical protein